MIALKLRRMGNALGVVLPKEVAARLNVTKGDTVFLTECPGGYRLTACDPAFESQMEEAQKIAKKRRSALRILAK